MEFLQLIDPELAANFEQRLDNGYSFAVENPVAARAGNAQWLAEMTLRLPQTHVTIHERTIPGPAGVIPIVIYQPPVQAPRPALLWIHGGAYLFGSAREDGWSIPIAEYAQCTIVSVDYRLAPEHPFPAAPEDCYAALLWMVENAAELGIDPDRIAMGGRSAGSGISASVALMNRDRHGPNLALQWLLYPMLDNTHETPSGHSITHPKAWNRANSLRAWKLYLGDGNSGSVSSYAAAARATDLSGLPPAYLCVGTLDLFRDETIDYAKRLMAAGVPTELVVYPGMLHGSEDDLPAADISKRMRSGYFDALKRAVR